MRGRNRLKLKGQYIRSTKFSISNAFASTKVSINIALKVSINIALKVSINIVLKVSTNIAFKVSIAYVRNAFANFSMPNKLS